ncbi:MAG: Flp family type IVb pilin [Longimicrobiales bacterium]
MPQRRLKDFLYDRSGTTLVEYGMLAMLIALLCIVALKLLGSKVAASYQAANSLLP